MHTTWISVIIHKEKYTPTHIHTHTHYPPGQVHHLSELSVSCVLKPAVLPHDYAVTAPFFSIQSENENSYIHLFIPPILHSPTLQFAYNQNLVNVFLLPNLEMKETSVRPRR